MLDIMTKHTCVVTPSYFESTEAMFTWGMIFFSTESWKSGGGGKSTAKKRNGDTFDLISSHQKGANEDHEGE